MKKAGIFGRLLDIVLVALMVLCVYGIICRINRQPISLAGYQLYVIRSGSMEPELKKYDLALVKAVDPASLSVGDIITFRRSDGVIVTHRIAEIGEETFVTRGDANPGNDADPVAFSDVYGKNIGRVRYLGAVFDFFQSGFGIALFVMLILVFAFKDKIGRFIAGEETTALPPGSSSSGGTPAEPDGAAREDADVVPDKDDPKE